MTKKYTIGIPARNEGKTIYHMLKSLRDDISTHSLSGTLETIVCINGTNDDTLEKVSKASDDFPELNIKSIDSCEGLIPAQQTILRNSSSVSDFVIFYNADTTITAGTTLRIIGHMEEHPEAHAVSGDQKPLEVPNLIYAVLNVEALHPEIFSDRRRYLLGRCFAIRKNSYFVPDEFLSDDMFLSNNLVHRYGPKAVQQVPDASVGYVGPQTIKDYFHKIRRYTMELSKLYANYPEFSQLKEHFHRKRDDIAVARATIKVRGLLLSHDVLKVAIKMLSRMPYKETWNVLETTKSEVLYD